MAFSAMQLVQIMLPLYDNSGRAISKTIFREERERLADRFGGMTAYLQSPAAGLWKEGGKTQRDRIVVYEVLVKRLNRGWWRRYQEYLRQRFRQRELLIRYQTVHVL